jgi:hypothetical protein
VDQRRRVCIFHESDDAQQASFAEHHAVGIPEPR